MLTKCTSAGTAAEELALTAGTPTRHTDTMTSVVSAVTERAIALTRSLGPRRDLVEVRLYLRESHQSVVEISVDRFKRLEAERLHLLRSVDRDPAGNLVAQLQQQADDFGFLRSLQRVDRRHDQLVGLRDH